MKRGDSNAAVCAALVALAWELIQRHHIQAWCSRVPCKLNPADLPTRGREVPFRPRCRGGFQSTDAIYRMRRAVSKDVPTRTGEITHRRDRPFPRGERNTVVSRQCANGILEIYAETAVTDVNSC